MVVIQLLLTLNLYLFMRADNNDVRFEVQQSTRTSLDELNTVWKVLNASFSRSREHIDESSVKFAESVDRRYGECPVP
jgi:hypothetical protein